MLSNAYFVAKFRFDTAENEPAKKFAKKFAKITFCKNFTKFANLADCVLLPVGQQACSAARGTAGRREPPRGRPAGVRWRRDGCGRRSPDAGLTAFFENFANFWRARSRLYQTEILQENMRSTAFFKLYKMCILLHRCNLKIFAKKNRFEKSAINFS